MWCFCTADVSWKVSRSSHNEPFSKIVDDKTIINKIATMTQFQNTTALNKTVSIFLSLTFLFWFFGFAESRRDGGEKFQCFKCEEDSEKPSKSVCTEVQTCFGRRPICAKLEFGAFFHGVMGTRTLKFCYDLVRFHNICWLFLLLIVVVYC